LGTLASRSEHLGAFIRYLDVELTTPPVDELLNVHDEIRRSVGEQSLISEPTSTARQGGLQRASADRSAVERIPIQGRPARELGVAAQRHYLLTNRRI
jgi:hypothetical protein